MYIFSIVIPLKEKNMLIGSNKIESHNDELLKKHQNKFAFTGGLLSKSTGNALNVDGGVSMGFYR